MYRTILFISCLSSGIQGFQINGKSTTWINLIRQISKHTNNDISILINDVPPYSMFNKKGNRLEGSDVITLRTILDKLNLKVSFTRKKDFDRVSEEYLE